jgi:aminoglycoside phosphotransferase (APT) family kinase protein
MLGVGDVADYLLDQRLLDPRAVVDGGLRVFDSSQLNRVFLVSAEGNGGLVVKVGPGVAHEAAVLERLRAAAPLVASLPKVVAHDRAAGVLVLEAAPVARDLARHHARGRFSSTLAAEAGRALASLHTVPPVALDGLALPSPAAPVHRPDLATLHTLSAAATDLTRIVQRSDDLCASLDALLGDPPESTVVHGDVRWANCVVLRGAAGRWTHLQLIDWELCGAGDPAVDVGAFVGEYLRAWLGSIPIADPRDPGRLLTHARLPLRRMRPALRAFWTAYALRAGETPTRLRRSMRFAALRLLASALEEAQAVDELPSSVLRLLPLGRNILARPDDALELVGLA